MSAPWTAFYWSDYTAKTKHLTILEHGAYWLLMAHYYTTGRPLLADASRLLRICNASTKEEVAAVDFVLKEFFTLDGGLYRHSRCDEEISKAAQIIDAKRFAGRIGGQTKAANRSKKLAYATAKGVAKGKQTATQPQPQPQPQNTERERARGEVPDKLEDHVSEIWNTYPSAQVNGSRKPAGQADQHAIAEAVIRDGFDLVIAGTRNYRDAVAQWPPCEKKYIRPPTRFFADCDYSKDPAIWDRAKTNGNVRHRETPEEWAAGFEERQRAKGLQ